MRTPRWRAAWTAVVTILLGLCIFRWSHGLIRTHGGDVLVILAMVACLAAAGLGDARRRLIGVGLFAVVTEGLQSLKLVGPDAPAWVHLTFGSTADPADLVAYLLGLGLSAVAERLWARP